MVELAGVYAVLAAMKTVRVVGGTDSRVSTSAIPVLLVIFQFHQHGWGLVAHQRSSATDFQCTTPMRDDVGFDSVFNSAQWKARKTCALTSSNAGLTPNTIILRSPN